MSKARKWTSLRGEFKPAPPESPEFDAAVKAEESALRKKPLKDQLALFAAKKAEKDALEDEISKINITLEALNRVTMEEFERQDLTAIRSAQMGKTFFIQDEPYPQIEDQDKLDAWIEKQDLGHMRKLPWQTLKTQVKNRLENGEPLPDGVEVFVKTSLRMRKS